MRSITPDCVSATAEYGKDRFEASLGAMVRIVKEALQGGGR